MSLLALDSRWRRFQAQGGVFDIGFDAPDLWPHDTPRDTGTSDVSAGDDRLSADLCKIGAARFLCALLELPLRGSEETIALAIWAEVPPTVFYTYIDHATDGADFPTTQAKLATDLPLPGCNSLALSAGAAGHRPTARADGALGALQSEGISFDGLLDLYAACGQDLRPALSQD